MVYPRPSIKGADSLRVCIADNNPHNFFEKELIVTLERPIEVPPMLHRRVWEIHAHGSVIFVPVVAGLADSVVQPVSLLDKDVRHTFQPGGEPLHIHWVRIVLVL